MRYEAQPHTARHELKEKGLWYITCIGEDDVRDGTAVKTELTEFEARVIAAQMNAEATDG